MGGGDGDGGGGPTAKGTSPSPVHGVVRFGSCGLKLENLGEDSLQVYIYIYRNLKESKFILFKSLA